MASVTPYRDDDVEKVFGDLVEWLGRGDNRFTEWEKLGFGKQILKADPEFRMRTVKWLVEQIVAVGETMSAEVWEPDSGLGPYSYMENHPKALPYPGKRLLKGLLSKKLPWSREDILWLIERSSDIPAIHTDLCPHVVPLIQMTENLAGGELHDPELDGALDRLFDSMSYYQQAEDSKIRLRIRRLQGKMEAILANEAWSDQALGDLAAMGGKERAVWNRLIAFCQNAKKSAPPEKWLEDVAQCLEEAGKEGALRRIHAWFRLVQKPRTGPLHEDDYRVTDPSYFIDYINQQILKGLVWCCALQQDEETARALRDLAVTSFKKIPGIGPRMMHVGWACIYILGEFNSRDGVCQLAILNARVKQPNVQKKISESLVHAATRLGMSKDELEEVSVPDYGMTEVGERRELLGDFTAILRITDTASTELVWQKPDGKTQASVPAAIKRDNAAEFAELKKAAADIQKMLPAQRQRLESLFLKQKSWPFSQWSKRYLNHPLAGSLARRLIWRFQCNGKAIAGFWLDGRLVQRDGRPIADLDDSARVELWHPLREPTEQVMAWRAWLAEWGVRQPFKQAHREIYPLTDAERATRLYSNRFAAHILRQHQFSALCAQRGWKYSLGIAADCGDPPPARLDLPEHGLVVELWVDPLPILDDSDIADSGALVYVATDQVRFYRSDVLRDAMAGGAAGGGTGNVPTVPLEEIHPLVFSEAMRDVDLFVGVASVGNNPDWADGGPGGRFVDYWSGFAFGDLSVSGTNRGEVLSALLPRLKIADRCEVRGRFLHVRGDLAEYKIHLGSSHIQIATDSSYLCIVPDKNAQAREALFLPFEGDRILSLILSKAFLLADDTKIKDQTILSQIKRP